MKICGRPAVHFSILPRSTGVSGELGTFSRAIVVEAPGYTERRALHSAFSFVAHLAAVMAIVWFWPLAFPQKPFVFAMGREFFTLPLFLPASKPSSRNLPFAPNAFRESVPVDETRRPGQSLLPGPCRCAAARRNPAIGPLQITAGSWRRAREHPERGIAPRRSCPRFHWIFRRMHRFFASGGEISRRD